MQKTFDSLRGSVQKDQIDVFISKIAIGECAANFYKDLERQGESEVGTWPEFASGLQEYIEKTEATLLPTSRDALATASDLAREDTRLGGDDAIIAATALEDDWSSHLISGDPDFFQTDVIGRADEQRQPTPRYRSLKIKETY